MNVNALSLNM